jgi:toxin CptA
MFPLPLVVEVGDSRQRKRYLMGLHSAAAVGVLLAGLPLLAQVASCLALGLSLAYYWRPTPPTRLRCHRDGAFEIWHAAEWRSARLDDASVIWPGFICLRHSQARRRGRCLLVLPDSIPAADFRRLRIWLRWRSEREAAKRPRDGDSPDQYR